MDTSVQLLASLQDPPREFRPVSFWFLNHFLEETELRRQVAEQDEKGFGGVMCHARDGLRTAYLEWEWEEAMRIIVDECEKRGMLVWLYDENHYPSGIAGGKIPKRFPGRTMLSLVPVVEAKVGEGERFQVSGVRFQVPDHENGDENGPRGAPNRPPLSSPLSSTEFKYLLAAGTRTGRTVNLLPQVKDGALSWTNDLGEPALLLAMVERGYETNPVNHPGFSFYPDYLDEEVCRGFMEETHEWYAKRFGDKFGTVIKGIFTDNACAHFGRIRRCVPWSRDLGERFAAATGIPFMDVLAKLLYPLPGHREARLRFWRFFGDEFIRVFVGAIDDWCKAHELHSTGHYCLEDGMGEHVRQIGNYFDVMKHMNFTGVDQIGIKRHETLWGIDGGEPLTACIRNTASAALFYDSPQVLCESFGCCSGWSFDLGEMHRIGGHLAALGVDLFVPHGLYYSIAGTRKYECIPDHLHHPMWTYYREWTDLAGRLSMLTSGSDSLAEIAILYPVATLQAILALGSEEPPSASCRPSAAEGEANLHAVPDNQPGSDRGADAERVRDLYDGLLDQLSQQHVSYEAIPEDVLQTGRPIESGLAVPTRGGRSSCLFKAVVLPGVQVIEAGSLAALQGFAEQGGTVLCLGVVPTEVYDPASGRLSRLSAPFLGGAAVLAGAGLPPGEAVAEACAWLRARVPQPIEVAGTEGALSSRTFARDGLRYYLLHNSTSRTVTGVSLALRDGDEPVQVDLDKPDLQRVPWQSLGGAWQTNLELARSESRLFVCGLPEADALPAAASPVALTDPTRVTGPWAFSTDRDNVLVLRQGRLEQRGSRQICTYAFEVDTVPAHCRLLLDLEMTLPELNAGRYCNRLDVRLNGRELRDPRPGTYLDRYIREVDVADALREGSNELVVSVAASLREEGQRLWPPMLVGDFTVWRGAGIERIAAPVRELALGDWAAQGYADFAGEGLYRTTVQTPAGTDAWLDLGDLADACEVWIDGQCLGRRIAPPWRFAIPPASCGERGLEVRVINTPNNQFETQPRPAGLFGPVCLKVKR